MSANARTQLQPSEILVKCLRLRLRRASTNCCARFFNVAGNVVVVGLTGILHAERHARDVWYVLWKSRSRPRFGACSQDKADAMVGHLASLAEDRLIISFAPYTFSLALLKRIGELFPGPSKVRNGWNNHTLSYDAVVDQLRRGARCPSVSLSGGPS